MILGGLCKTSFCFDLSVATGLFPCVVEYHCAGWECFLFMYWYLYLKVHLSATVVNSPLVLQTPWVSCVFCKRLSKDEVEQKGRGCQTLRNNRCDLYHFSRNFHEVCTKLIVLPQQELITRYGWWLQHRTAAVEEIKRSVSFHLDPRFCDYCLPVH